MWWFVILSFGLLLDTIRKIDNLQIWFNTIDKSSHPNIYVIFQETRANNTIDTGNAIGTWASNCIYTKMFDAITHPCPITNGEAIFFYFMERTRGELIAVSVCKKYRKEELIYNANWNDWKLYQKVDKNWSQSSQKAWQNSLWHKSNPNCSNN